MSTFSCPVVTIKEVKAHPNADLLDIITFNEIAWVCIDTKDKNLQPGQLVVYVPMDANVDTRRPEFEFLKPRAKSNGLCRIRQIKLRGEYSSGFILECPPTIIVETHSENPDYTLTNVNTAVGMDASYNFGIIKYEPPAEKVFSANAKGDFPAWCPKSDAERYQNWNRNINPHLNQEWFASLKMDGTSLTVFYDTDRVGDELGVCSRNQELKPPEENPGDAQQDTAWGFKIDLYWATARKFNLIEKIQKLQENIGAIKIALQGEICGPGIQENRMGLSDTYFFAFDLFVIGANKFIGYLNWGSFLAWMAKEEIAPVPILWKDNLETKLGNPPNFAFIYDLVYPNEFPAEGVVFVPEVEQRSGNLGRLKFKYINPEFLLKTKK
jgi:RNA ligase (TIGR02306 family)